MADRFQMLYCDYIRCRVNEFERGNGYDHGLCPGCSRPGEEIPARGETD